MEFYMADTLDFEKYLNKIGKEDQRKKDKLQKNKSRIEEKIFEFKVQKLNHIMEEKGIDFRFNIKKVNDHYEFAVPISTLFGPATRKFAAERWKKIMAEADIDMDFSEEVEEAMNQIKGISLVMKMNLKMTKETEDGDVEVDGKTV
jgi:hypothetical protein